MEHFIPSAGEIRARLQDLQYARVRAIAERSGIPFTTLWKMRSGETSNPGIETVRKFMSHLYAEDVGAGSSQVMGSPGNSSAPIKGVTDA